MDAVSHRPAGPTAGRLLESKKKIQELRRSGDTRGAADLLYGIMDDWHLSAPLVRIVGATRWSEDRRPSVAARLREIGLKSSGLVRDECVAGLFTLGDDAAAEELMGRDKMSAGANPPAAAATARQLADREVRELPMGAVTIGAKRGSTRCLFVFYGAMNGLQMPLPIFDKLLAPLDVHVVYVRDVLRTFCMSGIDGLGETMADALEGLRTIAAELGANDLYTMGTSSGGFSAARYGMALGAKGVMALGAPINFCPDAGPADNRGDHITTRVLEIVPHDQLDLRPFIREAAARTPLYLHYGTHHLIDSEQAKLVEGLPGVHLRPIDASASHAILRDLVGRGLFTQALAEATEWSERVVGVEQPAVAPAQIGGATPQQNAPADADRPGGPEGRQPQQRMDNGWSKWQ